MAGLVFSLTEKGASYQVKPTFCTLDFHKTLGKLSRGALSALTRRELRYRFFRNAKCKLKLNLKNYISTKMVLFERHLDSS